VGAGGITLGQCAAPQAVISGTLTINGGTVGMGADITDGGGTSTVTVNGGTLDLAGHNIGNATSSIDNLNMQSGTLANAAEINNGAGFNKTTTGTLALAGANSFTGTVNVNAGTLTVSGSVASSAAFQVNSSGTMVVNGKLANTNSIQVNNGGTLSGNGNGNTTGLAGNVTLGAGASLRPGATSADGQIGKLTTNNLT